MNNQLEQPQIQDMQQGELMTQTSDAADLSGLNVQPNNVQEETIIIGNEITPQDMERIYKKLGRPDEPDKYDLTEIVPDNFNKGLVDEFKKKAFDIGLSNEKTRELADWYKGVELKQVEAINNQRKAMADHHLLELKRDFGVNFEKEVNYARKAIDAYTDKSFKQYMDESGLGNHPALVKAFAKIGRELSEDKLVQSETANRLAGDEAVKKAEINRLRNDRQFMERYRKGDPAAVQRLNSLYLN